MYINDCSTFILANSLKSLLETVKTSEVRAQRDNDLVYHQDVPSSSALKVLSETILAVASVPKGLSNPSSILGSRHPLFSELASWGASEANSKVQTIGYINCPLIFVSRYI